MAGLSTRRAMSSSAAFPAPWRSLPWGDAVVSASDATACTTKPPGSHSKRKGLLNSMFPMAAVLTPKGVAYDTGLADKILHRRGGH